MKKYYYITAAVLVLILLLLILISRIITNKNTLQITQVTPKPTVSIPTLIPNPFTVTAVTPLNQATGISLNPEIIITFNKTITNNDILFSIEPPIKFTQKVNFNILTIKPVSNLDAGMLYTFRIKFPAYQTGTPTYTFTTIGPTKEFLPNTRPSGYNDAVKQDQLENAPDVYAANLLPFTNNVFAADYTFVSSPTGHYRIIVTKKVSDQEAVKASFISWLKSNGMNDSQIAKLDIVYQ